MVIALKKMAFLLLTLLLKHTNKWLEKSVVKLDKCKKSKEEKK